MEGQALADAAVKYGQGGKLMLYIAFCAYNHENTDVPELLQEEAKWMEAGDHEYLTWLCDKVEILEAKAWDMMWVLLSSYHKDAITKFRPESQTKLKLLRADFAAKYPLQSATLLSVADKMAMSSFFRI